MKLIQGAAMPLSSLICRIMKRTGEQQGKVCVLISVRRLLQSVIHYFFPNIFAIFTPVFFFFLRSAAEDTYLSVTVKSQSVLLSKLKTFYNVCYLSTLSNADIMSGGGRRSNVHEI